MIKEDDTMGFLPWLWSIVDLPALLLVAVMGIVFYVLYRIQANPENNFDFSDMFRDEKGKPSAARMMILVSGGVSSWAVMYMLVHSKESMIDPFIFGLYLGVWSGSALASKWMETNKTAQIANSLQGNVSLGVEVSGSANATATTKADPS